MALTDTAIKNAKPDKKLKRLYDEKGLFLEVTPKGGKRWRIKYYFEGKEKRISLGLYPEVSLKQARERRDEARKLVADGINPSEVRKAKKQAIVEQEEHAFEIVAREWFAKQEKTWAKSHSSKIIRRLEKDIFPFLGNKNIADISPPALLKVIQKIENRGTIESAHRAMQSCGQIFRYAVATGRAERDPTNDLKGALTPVKKQHFPAITDPKKIGGLLRTIESYEGTATVQAALRLAPLVFVRPGELRQAKWEDIGSSSKTGALCCRLVIISDFQVNLSACVF